MPFGQVCLVPGLSPEWDRLLRRHGQGLVRAGRGSRWCPFPSWPASITASASPWHPWPPSTPGRPMHGRFPAARPRILLGRELPAVRYLPARRPRISSNPSPASWTPSSRRKQFPLQARTPGGGRFRHQYRQGGHRHLRPDGKVIRVINKSRGLLDNTVAESLWIGPQYVGCTIRASPTSS